MKNIQNKLGISGRLKISKYKDGELVSIQKETNLIVSSSGHGRNLIIRQLAGNTVHGIAVDEGKIGTGTTAPTDGDTDLETPVLSSIVVASTSFSNDECTISFFIPDGDLSNGTYTEFGLFVGGQMFARAVFDNPYSKSTGEDTRIDYDISLSAN